MKKVDLKNVVLVILVIVILLLSGVIYLGYIGKIKFNSNVNNNVKTSNNDNQAKDSSGVITNEEAIDIGRKLYDKAYEIHLMWKLRPYCGISNEDIITKSLTNETTDFGLNGDIKYYKSSFTNLEDLKSYLREYLSDEIIDKNVTSYLIKDDVNKLLEDLNYAIDYVEKDGKLYCRETANKGWLMSYLGEYDLSVLNISDSQVTFNVKSTCAYDTENTECVVDKKLNKCKDSDIFYDENKFTIEKNSNNKWIVNNFTLPK